MSKTHLVLIHGAYHRAWHLSFLKKELERAGYAVTCIDLPACGEHPPADGGLEMDTAAVKRAIEVAARGYDHVIPLFHSYAGFPGSDAVAELSREVSNKIETLIYLAAFIPEQGTALFAGRGRSPALWATREGSMIRVPDPIPVFYTDVEPKLAMEAAARVVPHSYSSFTTKTKHAGWKLFPSTFILCSEDRTIPPQVSIDRFAAMDANDRRNWTYYTIESSHSPFLAKPKETARLIRKIAGEDIHVDAKLGLCLPDHCDGDL